jgi:hypothetical protein
LISADSADSKQLDSNSIESIEIESIAQIPTHRLCKGYALLSGNGMCQLRQKAPDFDFCRFGESAFGSLGDINWTAQQQFLCNHPAFFCSYCHLYVSERSLPYS